MKDIINQIQEHKIRRNQMKVGTAKYGSSYTKKNYFKLKDGDNVYRVLPPMGDLAEAGRWSVFYNIHYGYKNTQGKMRAFQSPLVKNRKTKMIESPDAALERIDSLKAELAKAKDAKDQGRIDRLSPLVGSQKSLYNLDSHHYMNVVDLQGNIGVLKIRHRCKLALDAEIKRLREEEGVDPLSADNGRFLVFRRSGSALDTTFQVTVYQESQTIGGQKVKVDKAHSIVDATTGEVTKEWQSRLEREAFQLDKMFKRPTSEEVALIVENADLFTGISAGCDAVFDKAAAQAAAAQDDANDEEPEPDYEEPKAAPIAKKAAPATAPASSDAAPKAAVAKAAPAPTPAPAAPAAELSDDEFLASLGLAK
jgi:hypothetical protein